MEAYPNIQAYIDTIQADRAKWNALLMQFSEDEMLQPGVCGHWSIKDIIAHFAWYELEILRVLQLRSFGLASPMWGLSLDERNAQIYEDHKNFELKPTIHFEEQVYHDLIATLSTFRIEELTDPDQFAEMIPGYQPIEIISQNMHLHYLDHAQQLEAYAKKLDK
ncbi:MAG: DinB family protein [Anaerolineaceae bacterium]|nr:DinB family protein [Anaerolineaceae bacterium]